MQSCCAAVQQLPHFSPYMVSKALLQERCSINIFYYHVLVAFPFNSRFCEVLTIESRSVFHSTSVFSFSVPLPSSLHTGRLTTRVRRQRVPAGARGSKAATRSHTLIFLKIKKGTKVFVKSKIKGAQEERQKVMAINMYGEYSLYDKRSSQEYTKTFLF